MLAAIYPWLKVVHLGAVIAWMAGMMYLPRLFIYHHQSIPGGEAAQFFQMMERRLLKGIMTPAMVVAWIFAVLLMFANPSVLGQGWLHIKLVFVLAMSGVHGFYSASQKKFANDERPRTEKFWRIMNEVPFVFLVVILIMVLVKPFV